MLCTNDSNVPNVTLKSIVLLSHQLTMRHVSIKKRGVDSCTSQRASWWGSRVRHNSTLLSVVARGVKSVLIVKNRRHYHQVASLCGQLVIVLNICMCDQLVITSKGIMSSEGLDAGYHVLAIAIEQLDWDLFASRLVSETLHAMRCLQLRTFPTIFRAVMRDTGSWRQWLRVESSRPL